MKFLNGFRKWSMAALFLGTAVILLITKQIPSKGWIEAVGAVMIAFFGTNVGEHIIDAAKEWVAKRKD